MTPRSILYKNPRIYLAGLKLFHRRQFDERYRYISEQIGEGKSVLEPACGPAILPGYLHPSNSYHGFDINGQFVLYAQGKGWDVTLGNALDSNAYIKSDVVVFCDSLHHMGPDNEKLVMEKSLKSAKQNLIVCEPFKGRNLEKLLQIPGAKFLLEGWFNYSEKDGHNQVRLEHIRTRKELEASMMDGYGVIPNSAKRELKNIGGDLIVTYHL
jgi:hypothetical protein